MSALDYNYRWLDAIAEDLETEFGDGGKEFEAEVYERLGVDDDTAKELIMSHIASIALAMRYESKRVKLLEKFLNGDIDANDLHDRLMLAESEYTNNLIDKSGSWTAVDPEAWMKEL